MRIQVDFSVLEKTKWHEYAMRFLFGGAITAIAGIIAKKYEPVLGGLFLACPAIFPASATLIEKHEKQRKEILGLHGEIRGIEAAGVDANGSALGSIGLLVFAAVAWKFNARTQSRGGSSSIDSGVAVSVSNVVASSQERPAPLHLVS
jgi:hypothetical protein